jgi:hypothetical protein
VVFPEPVSPTTATCAPAGTSKDTSRTTTGPSPYRYQTPSARTGSAPWPSVTPDVGSAISTGSSSSARILRHPAIAVWVCA